MPQQTIDEQIAKLNRIDDVLEGVVVWIEGSAARQQAAVDAALEAGATPAQVAQMQAEIDESLAKAEVVANAIVTPPTP